MFRPCQKENFIDFASKQVQSDRTDQFDVFFVMTGIFFAFIYLLTMH